MPLKIAGNAISTIFALIVAIKMPRVVFESATHLYLGPTSTDTLPFADMLVTPYMFA